MVKDNPNRKLSAAELYERQDDLAKAMNLFKSIHGRLETITPMIEAAISDASRLQQMCEKNAVLRAAMVSRRLSVQMVTHDIMSVRVKAVSISKHIGKTMQSRAPELEESILDPELLR